MAHKFGFMTNKIPSLWLVKNLNRSKNNENKYTILYDRNGQSLKNLLDYNYKYQKLENKFSANASFWS